MHILRHRLRHHSAIPWRRRHYNVTWTQQKNKTACRT